jgi:UDP-N-acetylmuramoyl-tripeptide--D-alanyl-D-alanine ligase
VPLVLFGCKLPGLLNVPAWLKIFLANEKTIRSRSYYDIAVLELGTDHPGDMANFAYLKPDITVVTAVTPEHMEYFGTLDAVAAEELTVCDYSRQVVINADDTPATYLKGRNVLRYGLSAGYEFHASHVKPQGLAGSDVTLHLQQSVQLKARAAILGLQGVKILLAAAASAQLAGLSDEEIAKGLKEVQPFAGRMQILDGIKDSTIIDDSYNASPQPVKAALDVLYETEAPQRIAVLGNMNELGDYSQEAHEEIGNYCDPARLDLIITIGPDAKRYLAVAAAARGCEVVTTDGPYEAGDILKRHLAPGAVVLVEGSQNGVFAEESIKSILAKPADAKRLVRQSADWLAIKRKL